MIAKAFWIVLVVVPFTLAQVPVGQTPPSPQPHKFADKQEIHDQE